MKSILVISLCVLGLIGCSEKVLKEYKIVYFDRVETVNASEYNCSLIRGGAMCYSANGEGIEYFLGAYKIEYVYE